MQATKAVGKELYLGIMSGTSLDGLDVALFDLSDSITTIAHEHLAYSADVRAALKNLCEAEHLKPEQLMLMDSELGKLSAECVNRLLSNNNLAPASIKAIGSHGQTVRHVPPPRSKSASMLAGQTLQIGDPNTIAALTGIPVVADFRRANMAHGGQGAPLAPAFHQAAFGHGRRCAVVNIGGMANITVLGLDQIIGFDCGPGNALMDAWTLRHLNKPYDKAGQWAASGSVHQPLLRKLLAHEFFALAAPKSTGREQFNQNWLQNQLDSFGKLSAADVQTTLLELTATSICECVDQSWQLDELFVCGGGANNTVLLERIAALRPELSVHTSAKLGIDPELVECCAFAWFAQQTLARRTIAFKDFTGANKDSVAGGVYFG
ncbi:MAG: anhydro-N-acetylmuramic acid kinase [Pseudomonadales bacterium]